MSATDVYDTSRDASVGRVDMKLEVMIIPVSDVDRSKEFYERLGWNLDRDVAPMEGLRIVQFTPPGSGTSSLSPPEATLVRMSIHLRFPRVPITSGVTENESHSEGIQAWIPRGFFVPQRFDWLPYRRGHPGDRWQIGGPCWSAEHGPRSA